MRLTLNNEERSELLELVEAELEELQVELHQTKASAYRDTLKRRHGVLGRLVKRLQSDSRG